MLVFSSSLLACTFSTQLPLLKVARTWKFLTKSLKLNNPFPSEKAWVEIGEKYNKNSKNIQQTYNLISSNKNERLKMTKIRNLEYVIEFMLISKENALKLAKDELNLAQLNS